MDRRGCGRGWTLLTKDRRIRYRTDELRASTSGHLFCLADGNVTLDQIAQRFLDAMPAIHRAIQNTDVVQLPLGHVHYPYRVEWSRRQSAPLGGRSPLVSRA